MSRGQSSRQRRLDRDSLLALIQQDPWMMQALRCVDRIELKDWWIVAGFVRHKAWDFLHDYEERSFPNDIDVVFFDPLKPPAYDRGIEQALNQVAPDYPWEVYNQAHMHTYNGHSPYSSCVDSFSRWAETVSTVGIRLEAEGTLQLAAPHGIDDLVNMVIRPTPHGDASKAVFEKRLLSKGWLQQWPRVTVQR